MYFKGKHPVASWYDPKKKDVKSYKVFPKETPLKIVREFERKAKLGLLTPADHSDRSSFSEWSEVWLNEYAKIHKVASSVEKDQGILRNHLNPRFGDFYVDQIDIDMLYRFQRDLLENGFKAQSINNIFGCLSMILSHATQRGLIRLNPCKSLKRMRVVQKSPSFWTPEQSSKFLEYVRDRDFETFQLCSLALTTGMRPGELQGLLRDCIDFESGYVTIRRNYCTKTHRIVEYTKTKRDRKVEIPRPVLEGLSNKYHLKPHDRVFNFSCNSFGKRKIQKYAKECGVPPIRFHDLRHTFASQLAMMNVHQVMIRDLLGHTKLDTTNVYMHLAEDSKRGVTSKLVSGWAHLTRDEQVISLANYRRS